MYGTYVLFCFGMRCNRELNGFRKIQSVIGRTIFFSFKIIQKKKKKVVVLVEVSKEVKFFWKNTTPVVLKNRKRLRIIGSYYGNLRVEILSKIRRAWTLLFETGTDLYLLFFIFCFVLFPFTNCRRISVIWYFFYVLFLKMPK